MRPDVGTNLNNAYIACFMLGKQFKCDPKYAVQEVLVL